MTCGSLCAHWTTPEWLAGAQGQPRRSDETSRMSAHRLIAAECCTAAAGAPGHFRTHAAQHFARSAMLNTAEKNTRLIARC